MTLGRLQTNKSWGELLTEVKAEFTRWGFEDVIYPTKRDSLNSGQVEVLVRPLVGEWQPITCGAFDGHNGPERNLCAIREAVRAMRLADQRGIAAVLVQASSLLALPEGGDRYSVLGVGRNATLDDIRRAYRQKLRETHPDHGGSSEMFMRVQEAGKALGVA